MINNINYIEAFLQRLSTGEEISHSVYFIGIGGIGISAIARYFNSRGVTVSGYDKTETLLTQQLQKEGIQIHYEDHIDLVDKNALFVVYTPAVPASHNELNYFKNNGYAILKRSEVLGMITSHSFNICIAGTHGKTTTSSMIAHILRHSEFGCNAFLGGIATNYNTNFWSNTRNVCVVEADEYDRSFLKLNPDIAIITAMDPDHLDIYGTAENFKEAFISFSQKVKPGGVLISKYELENETVFNTSKHLTYSVQNNLSNCFAKNITTQNGSYHFDVQMKDKIMSNFILNMGGLHNVENAVVSIVAADYLEIEEEKIKSAVACFKGVKRRFEYIIKRDDFVLIDDYAHHPQELTALIDGVKKMFSGKKCIIIFQPHLFSRTKDFAEGFSNALSMADEVYLLPIYPARELPISGVSSEMLTEKMSVKKVTCCSKEELIFNLKQKKSDFKSSVLIMAGAGDIDTMVLPVKNIFE